MFFFIICTAKSYLRCRVAASRALSAYATPFPAALFASYLTCGQKAFNIIRCFLARAPANVSPLLLLLLPLLILVYHYVAVVVAAAVHIHQRFRRLLSY